MVLVIISVISAVLLSYLMGKACDSGVDSYHKEHMAKVEQQHPGVFERDSNYSFFVDGHPYVWSSTDFDGVMASLRNFCVGPKGMPSPPIGSIKVDTANQRAYVVSRSENFDFSKRMHYDEWIESNKVYAERIARYNAEKNR